MAATGIAALAQVPIRVLVVDDSSVARAVIVRALTASDRVEVVGAVGDGEAAITAARREADCGRPVEVVLLDVEMPRLGGLEALPRLLALSPAPRVIMASSHTRRGAAITLRALSSGAADYLCKPEAASPGARAEFERELLVKVEAWASSWRRACARGSHPFAAGPVASPPANGLARPPAAGPNGPRAGAGAGTRNDPVRVVAIGASTGGPQALAAVLGHLRGHHGPPLLITQHMPANFTPILAEHLARVLDLPCAEGIDGEPVVDGRVFVAPGGRHMIVEGDGRGSRIRLTDGPPENFCRPAVDPLLRSVAAVYGRSTLAVILTGMGQDGLVGCEAVALRGGRILVQDEATSVVWGMPGSVVRRGLADDVLPLHAIGRHILRLLGGREA